MNTNAAKILLVLLMLSFGAGGWAGYKVYTLTGEKTNLLSQVASLERKVAQFKGKLAEQTALVNQYSRIKTNLESELRVMQAKNVDMEKRLAEETASLQAEIKNLKTSGEETAEKHEQQIAKYKDAIGQWKTQYEALRDESIEKIQERERSIAELKNENEIISSQLSSEKQEHNYCRKVNARFAELSRSIIMSYENKSVIDTLKENEPLTQLEKIELEKMVQEYQDEIDRNSLQVDRSDLGG